jgi:hypothetical protein
MFNTFRWTAEDGLTEIPPPANNSYVYATDVTFDGSGIVGFASASQDPYIWDAANGIRNLKEVLITDYGLEQEVAAWNLGYDGTHRISADGRTIIGKGVNPPGQQEGIQGWIAILDPPPGFLAGDYDENGQVDQADLDLVLLKWGKLGYPLPVGWVNDLPIGNIDQAELVKVLLSWGNTPPVVASTTAVPEPQTWHLLIVSLAALALARLIARHHAASRHHPVCPGGAMFRDQAARPKTSPHADPARARPHAGGRGSRHAAAAGCQTSLDAGKLRRGEEAWWSFLVWFRNIGRRGQAPPCRQVFTAVPPGFQSDMSAHHSQVRLEPLIDRRFRLGRDAVALLVVE